MSNEYEGFTIKELEDLISGLTLQQRELRQEKLAIQTVLSRKQQAAEAARKASTMTPGEKEALLQVLQAEGITTSEEFGEI